MNRTALSIPETVFDPELFAQALKSASKPAALVKKYIERTTDYFHQQFQQGTYIRELVW